MEIEVLVDENRDLLFRSVQAAKNVLYLTIIRFCLESISQLILVRLLAPDIFGIFAFIQIFIGAAQLIATLHTNQFVILYKGEINRIKDSAFTIEFSLNILIILITLIISPILMRSLGRSELTAYIQILAFSMLLSSLTLPRAFLERELNFKAANVSLIWGNVAKVMSSLILALLGCGIWSLIGGQLFRLCAETIFVRRTVSYQPKIRFDKRVGKELCKFGFPLTLSGMLAYFYWNIDNFLVGRILGNVQLGYYWLAFTFPHYILQVVDNFSNVALASFSSLEKKHQLEYGYELIMKYAAILTVFPCVVTLALGKETIRYIFGEKWLPATVPFQIFMVLVTFQAVIFHWVSLYLSRGKTRATVLSSLFNLVSIFALGYYLITKTNLGILGMSIAVFFSVSTSVLFITTVVIRKIIKVNYIRTLQIPVISGLLIFAIALITKHMFQINMVSYCILVFLLFLIYGLVVLALDYNSVSSLMSLLFKNNKAKQV